MRAGQGALHMFPTPCCSPDGGPICQGSKHAHGQGAAFEHTVCQVGFSGREAVTLGAAGRCRLGRT